MPFVGQPYHKNILSYHHHDYDDFIYDQPNNESLCQTIESVQYI